MQRTFKDLPKELLIYEINPMVVAIRKREVYERELKSLYIGLYSWCDRHGRKLKVTPNNQIKDIEEHIKLMELEEQEFGYECFQSYFDFRYNLDMAIDCIRCYYNDEYFALY